MRYCQTREKKGKRYMTGINGIAFCATTRRRKDGAVRHYFVAFTSNAQLKPLIRRHCLETLGRHEAWRRALRDRAEHERRVAGVRAGVPTTPAREVAVHTAEPDTRTLRRNRSRTQSPSSL